MHPVQNKPNTLTSGISTLKKKWILKMSLWNIVRPSTCRQISSPSPYTAICSNGYGLRSWVLIQALRSQECVANTPERDGSVQGGRLPDTGY